MFVDVILIILVMNVVTRLLLGLTNAVYCVLSFYNNINLHATGYKWLGGVSNVYSRSFGLKIQDQDHKNLPYILLITLSL